jgi:TolA-binding protein
MTLYVGSGFSRTWRYVGSAFRRISRRLIIRRLLRVAPVCLAISLSAAPNQGSNTQDDLARRQYESGLEFMMAGKYVEALKDLETVVDSYPASSVADDALLAIARYRLDVLRNPELAQSTAESVLKRFPASDSVPMAYVVAGQAMVGRGYTAINVEAALASFDRVERLFPGAEAVAPALVAAGDTLRRLGRCPEALDRFDRVTLAYPRSSWALAARVSSAACLAVSGRPLDALQQLHRVVAAAPSSAEAQQARRLGTIVYRLYVRPPAQSPYGFAGDAIAGAAGKLKDVSALAFGPEAALFVASKGGIVALDRKGTTLRSVSAVEPRALFVDAQGRVVAAQKALLVQDATPAPQLVTLTVPRGPGPAKVLGDISAVAVLASGERLVADRGERGVFKFDGAGKYLGTLASIRASRIALGPVEQIALLDRDTKSVAIYDRAGQPLARIASKGTSYELTNPADLAFDVLGHLYVLDGTQVAVFAPDGRLVAVFTGGDRTSQGALRGGTAMALDQAARLYIYDDRAERVQIYQ